MATGSILRIVKISNTPFCRSFADAIDKTKSLKRSKTQYKSECRDLEKEKVKSFLKNSNM